MRKKQKPVLGFRRPPRKRGREFELSTNACWVGMIARCYNQRNADYKNYGGRGIRVCGRWLESFDNFLADMGARPLGMSLDRVDCDGDYHADNCRWATQRTQQNNRRDNHWITVGGERKTIAMWARERNIHPRMLSKRLARGWPHTERLFIPPISPKAPRKTRSA